MAARNEFLPIYDLTPFTMLDFPDRIACIVWFSGCNMRCPYCHNPEIVKGKAGKLTEKQVEGFLKSRRGLLEGVVLSGGEASLYQGIIPFARMVRSLGFAIKLDTNGARPDIVRQLLDENLLDYIAMDYKAPKDKFKLVTGIDSWKAFDESLDLLCRQTSVPLEIRTTVHRSLLCEQDIARITRDLQARGFSGNYYVQNFKLPEKGTLGNLGPQDGELLPAVIQKQAAISVQFRNFSALPLGEENVNDTGGRIPDSG